MELKAMWDWLVGATGSGPAWLSLLLGAASLSITLVGIVYALWPLPRAADIPRGEE